MTLGDILSLPGNRPVFDALKHQLAADQAVAFVGAGASAGLYPMWGTFIGQLADYAVAQGKAEPRDAARWKSDNTSTPQVRVNVILRKLGEPLYRTFLKDSFSPRKGADGKRYTPTHAALMRLPFRGFVTTNYDPALEFARTELRPQCLNAGTPTWEDDDEVYGWRTGDAFRKECPILWAHGYWQRPSGIVLNSGEYSQAYKAGIYRDTFKELWIREHLVFVGFGFADPQFTFMVGECLRDSQASDHPARHIAILGWPMAGDGSPPDADELAEKRDVLEADYHVRVLFYPVQGYDHSALGVLLDALAPQPATPPPSPLPVAVASSALAARWVHETTDDAKFTGRAEEMARLNRWVRDPTVRVIGLCAVGGTGKTALTGHWLKATDGWRSRPFAGLFAWSFYQDRSTTHCLDALLHWAHEVLARPKPHAKTDLTDAATRLLREHPLVVVLDGLEVLQEGPDDARHGSFLDGELREFLHAVCQLEDGGSLVLLTSRFVFADLERHLGGAFHQLDLPGLDPEEGARLLRDLGVRGSAQDRETISERLDGHPLGLRIFAGALPDGERDAPFSFLNHAFSTGEITPGAPLNDKLLRLLSFYEKQLPPEQVRLLSVVALFRSPVAEETILRLARGLFGEDPAPPHEAALTTALRRLHRDHILTREPIRDDHGYAAHPVLRDHFRRVLLRGGADTARRAADLLKGSPADEKPTCVEEIEPVLLAIELLLDADEFRAASELYGGRLDYGRIFLNLPAMPEGLACALGFVRDEARRERCQELLGLRRLSFFLNNVGLFANNGGHYELAMRSYSDAAAIDRNQNDSKNLITDLRNESELGIALGRLADAQQSATEALDLAIAEKDEEAICDSLASRASATSQAGRVSDAADDFARANELEKKNDADGDELYSLRGLQWAELHLRTGHPVMAAKRTAANLRVCAHHSWNGTVARCHAMLAACAVTEGRLDDAEAEIRLAEPVLRRGQILLELAKLHLTAGALALARKDAPGALHEAAEALTLAASRGMRLVHADALVLRGQARLLAGDSDRARDDAEEGLRIARDCGYPWAERDALRLLVAAGSRDAAKHRAEADTIAARLVLTAEDLAAADAKAEAWLAEWEKTNKKP